MNIRFFPQVLACALACALPALPAHSASFVAPPDARLSGAGPASLRLEGLPANAQVQVQAERIVVSQFLGGQRRRFRSEATFTSDARGMIELATATPRSGSYREADIRGLFWSMQPTGDAVTQQDKPGAVKLAATVDGKRVAELSLPTGVTLPVTVVDVAGFPGAVYARPAEAKAALPVVILLGGAEGGSAAAREHAPKLAALGFAVFGLPYVSPASMPDGPRELPALPGDFANIEVTQLNKVRDWLGQQAGVDIQRIGLYGASKGAEFALLAASQFDWIKAVVAVTPSDVVWEGYGWGVEPGTASSFAVGGKPMAYVPYQGFAEEYMRFGAGQPVHLRRPHDQGRAANADRVARARIPVERFKGKLLLLAGQDDQLWNSAAMAHNIAERRAEAGLPTELRVYSDAGHYLIGDGWSPTTHYNMGLKQSGGTPAGNAGAQVDARERISRFLQRSL